MAEMKPKNVARQAQDLVGANFSVERPVQKIIWALTAGIGVLYAAATGAKAETLIDALYLMNDPGVFVPVLLAMIAVWRDAKR